MNHERLDDDEAIRGLRRLVDLGKMRRDDIICQSVLDRMDRQAKDEEIKWNTPMSHIRAMRQSQR